MNRLKEGSFLTKIKINGKSFERRFYIDSNETFLSYERVKKFKKPNVYRFDDIDEIRSGFQSAVFQRLVSNRKLRTTDESRAFSIYYNDHRNELHLLAPLQQLRDTWVEVLTNLLSRHRKKGQMEITNEQNWILKHFRSADKNHSNTLNKRECQELLAKSFNVVIPKKTLDYFFKKADRSGEGHLTSDEFIEFFRLLTRREDLYELMKMYSKNAKQASMDEIFFDHHELLAFLEHEQKIKLTHHRYGARNFIEKYELNVNFRDRGLLSLDGFRNLLLSDEFDIMSYQASHQIYQDMTLPLSHYYINTSHNTYLFTNQIIGESNPEAYNRALLVGCRAIEFDCYDGDENQPVVKHGGTLIESCRFETIIRLIEPNLFKTSPYPVILNIQTACSSKQRIEIARILKTILGDKLVTSRLPNDDPSYLPSPEDLKYKVLVRCKRKKPTSVDEADEDSVSSFSIEEDRSDLDDLCVYLENVKYQDLRYARKHYTASHTTSLAESRFLKLTSTEPEDIVAQTSWRILRVYPDGTRIKSSNQDPVPVWNHGVQMAAMNFQKNDDMMALYYGKFRDNGNCGYVLKPRYLIEGFQVPFNPNNPFDDVDTPELLKITIISGQFLSRQDKDSSDIPDPFVNISIHGLSYDQADKKTRVVRNNGFNPRWNETFEFFVRHPKLALTYFTVHDSDRLSDDEQIGMFCLPVTMIQPGYRHIHLRAQNNDVTYATLFVHIQRETQEEQNPESDVIRRRF